MLEVLKSHRRNTRGDWISLEVTPSFLHIQRYTGEFGSFTFLTSLSFLSSTKAPTTGRKKKLLWELSWLSGLVPLPLVRSESALEAWRQTDGTSELLGHVCPHSVWSFAFACVCCQFPKNWNTYNHFSRAHLESRLVSSKTANWLCSMILPQSNHLGGK
jgi:hypothetical protein